MNDNKTVAITNNLYIWNINTNDSAIIYGLSDMKSEDRHVLAAINDNYIVTISYALGTKAWRLSPDLSGTPESNPLLWIMQKATTLQQDLIRRAYEATIDRKKLTITLPEDPGITRINESQEIKDGRLYPTLTLAVRNYLRSRLNIEVY